MNVVEKFLMPENVELIHDENKLDEWNQLVEELGLDKQPKNGNKSPIPFLPMSKTHRAVFETLCPSKVGISEYSKTIPLEVLKLASLAKKEEYFQKIEIWHNEEVPDPVCVGVTGYWYFSGASENKYKSRDEARQAEPENKNHLWLSETSRYLIARWGDVAKSFELLREEARASFTRKSQAETRKQIKELETKLSNIEDEATILFG
jgi:hypothetical protein